MTNLGSRENTYEPIPSNFDLGPSVSPRLTTANRLHGAPAIRERNGTTAPRLDTTSSYHNMPGTISSPPNESHRQLYLPIPQEGGEGGHFPPNSITQPKEGDYIYIFPLVTRDTPEGDSVEPNPGSQQTHNNSVTSKERAQIGNIDATSDKTKPTKSIDTKKEKRNQAADSASSAPVCGVSRPVNSNDAGYINLCQNEGIYVLSTATPSREVGVTECGYANLTQKEGIYVL